MAEPAYREVYVVNAVEAGKQLGSISAAARLWHTSRQVGTAFLILVLSWLRLFEVEVPVTFQTDWGREFGGDSPRHVADW